MNNNISTLQNNFTTLPNTNTAITVYTPAVTAIAVYTPVTDITVTELAVCTPVTDIADDNPIYTNNNFDLIKEFLTLERKEENIGKDGGYLLIVSENLDFKDISSIREFLNTLNIIIENNKNLYSKGYINTEDFNLSITHRLHIVLETKDLNIANSDVFKKLIEKHRFSITHNILCNQLFMVYLYYLIVITESKYHILLDKKSVLDEEEDSDLNTDINTVRIQIFNTLKLPIKQLLVKKGLSIISTSLVGYDSEYELKSSLHNKNSLLSIQLAGLHEMVLKVPIMDHKPLTLEYLTLTPLKPGVEDKFILFLLNSMSSTIKSIRDLLWFDNDNLLKQLTENLSYRQIDKTIIGTNTVFKFPKSDTLKHLEYVNEYSSKELILASEALHKQTHVDQLLSIIDILNILCDNHMTKLLVDSINRSSEKSLSRITYKYLNGSLSISIYKDTYICMHESGADLSILSDFEQFKQDLDLIARSFVTIGRPIRYEWNSSRVYIRDTVLLAPGGSKSLAALGKLYGDSFNKIDIGSYRQGRLRELILEDKSLFESYAIRDAEITLKHACNMTDFYFKLNKIGVPLTLSGIGSSYVLKEWDRMNYKGYKIRQGLNMGNLVANITPKGSRAVGFSDMIIPFIQSFRGGRNESFMYGVEVIKNSSKTWYDYDLTSCYTTVMSLLGHPNINKAIRMTKRQVSLMTDQTLMEDYITMEVEFHFEPNVKFPCIPTRAEDYGDIYPMKGKSIITGIEYLVAKSMGYYNYLNVISCVKVPRMSVPELEQHDILKPDILKDDILKADKIFKKKPKGKGKEKSEAKGKGKTEDLPPFWPYREIIRTLQQKRREHPPKTFLNLMYKEIGNSIYGQIAMGISGKVSRDIRSNTMKKIGGGELSNPILASYITGFTRALIGECLNNIHEMKGSILSVTTDGFITDVEDLEEKLLSIKNPKRLYCLNMYREMRRFLTTFEGKEPDPRALEIKTTESKGIISIKTRGQLGLTENGITAATGFQTRDLDRRYLWDLFSRKIKSRFEYIQSGLRSGYDIHSKGGHMIVKYKDVDFGLNYDNKRKIIDKKDEWIYGKEDKIRVTGKINKTIIKKEFKTKVTNFLPTENLLDSVPWASVQNFIRIRTLLENVKKNPYDMYRTGTLPKAYKSHIETSVRAFIKACYSNDPEGRYGIPVGAFTSYDSLIDFIRKYEPAHEVKLTKHSISNLRRRVTITRTVPRTEENILFIQYVKETFTAFDDDRFFKELSKESTRKRILDRINAQV